MNTHTLCFVPFSFSNTKLSYKKGIKSEDSSEKSNEVKFYSLHVKMKLLKYTFMLLDLTHYLPTSRKSLGIVHQVQ